MLCNMKRTILFIWITISSNIDLVLSDDIRILGPHCSNTDDDRGDSLNCGSSVEPNLEGGSISLKNLCSDESHLQLRIWRNDVNIQVSNLKVEAYLAKVSECDDNHDDVTLLPQLMEQMTNPSGDTTISSNLTADISEIEFPSDVAEGKICGNVRIIFMIKGNTRNSPRIYGTKSVQINITCPSNDNLDDTSIQAIYGSEEIPDVNVGDTNPFGNETDIIVSYGSCKSPKTMACMYCGFEDGLVGVDDDSWNLWQTIEGRRAWAEGWQSQSDIFEKLFRAGLCEPMHMEPLLDDAPETLRANVSMKLNRTFVPLPWAYDALKNEYVGKIVRCGMMVSVDLFQQCSDRVRTNNIAVFPVRLNINEDRVEEVREDVQLNWPHAETGVALEDQNRACTVLSNYFDNGKSAMVFPTPQIDGFENEAGMIYKKGQFLPLAFHDGRLWSSLVMSKLTMVNQDQCPSQCQTKYQETQNAPNDQQTMIEKVGKVINDTDDVIQRLRNSNFNDDLSKYKIVSQMVRELYQSFSSIPKINHFMGKMMMKMITGGKKNQRGSRRNKGGRHPVAHHPNEEHCNTESVTEMIEHMEDDELRSGLYFLPNYQNGHHCWTEGCDYEESLNVCQQQGGSIAMINNPHENQMIRWLVERFGEFHPDQCNKDFLWFYIGLREEKSIDGSSHYHWEGGSNSNFTNWGGEEPNDYNGDSEECTFVIPETPGNFLSLDEGGPMWGDINCMATEFQWPSNPSSYVRMVPICEVSMSRCQNEELICENGGSCWDKADGSSECVCFGGYTGSRCEYPPDDTNQESTTDTSTMVSAETTEGGWGFGRKKREDDYGWGSIFKRKTKKNDRFSGKENDSNRKKSFGSRGSGSNKDEKGAANGKHFFNLGNDESDDSAFGLQKFRKGNQKASAFGTKDRQQSRGQGASNWGQNKNQKNRGFGDKSSQGSQRGGSKKPNTKGGFGTFDKGNGAGKRSHSKNGGWSGSQDMYDDNTFNEFDNLPVIADDWFGSSNDKSKHHGTDFGGGHDTDWNYTDYTEDWNEFPSHPIYDDYRYDDSSEDWFSGDGIEGDLGNDMIFSGSELHDLDDPWDDSNKSRRKGNQMNQNNQLKRKQNKNNGRLNRNREKFMKQRQIEKHTGVFGRTMSFKDMFSCNDIPTCGNGGIMQELKGCLCESFWSKDADPTGHLCQSIPRSTREKVVRVISMFMKGNGPAIPKNRTTIRKMKRMAATWGEKLARLVTTPFEKDDTQMLLQMERDNLTDGLSDLESNGISRSDLAAPTLYKDLVIGALASDSVMDSLTDLVQMIQGMSHQNVKSCDRAGKPGDAPTQEEFCMAYRTKKLTDQYKCPFVMELKQHLNNNALHEDERKVLIDSIKSFGGMDEHGGKGSCRLKRKSDNDIPTIWRKHRGNIVKASFCELDGEWYWSTVATCGGSDLD